jgi:hypothetical protein
MATPDTHPARTGPFQRRRGKSFPTLPLDEAVAVIKKAGTYGRQHSVGSFAGYLGHSSATSGPFRTKLAALNDWGLIERSGDEVCLTELALLIAHPTSSEMERENLQEAFFHAGLFAAIYEDSAKGADLSLELIGNRAVTTLSVAAKSKDRFARSFARSAVAAGLGQMPSEGTVRLLARQSAEDATAEPEGAREADVGTSALHSTVQGRSSAAAAHKRPPTLHQEWAVSDGVVVFEVRLRQALPGAAFAQIAEIASAVEGLVALLGEPDDRREITVPSPGGADGDAAE